MSDSAERVKDYLQIQGKIRQITFYSKVQVEEMKLKEFPYLTRTPYECKCGEFYAVDTRVIPLLERIGALKCSDCGEGLDIIVPFTRSQIFITKGLHNQDPYLDMKDVYKSRDDIEKHGKVQQWHDNF